MHFFFIDASLYLTFVIAKCVLRLRFARSAALGQSHPMLSLYLTSNIRPIHIKCARWTGNNTELLTIEVELV